MTPLRRCIPQAVLCVGVYGELQGAGAGLPASKRCAWPACVCVCLGVHVYECVYVCMRLCMCV
jgi:hypothetical protein